MDSKNIKILDFILLVVIFAIVIHIVVQYFGNGGCGCNKNAQTNENMNTMSIPTVPAPLMNSNSGVPMSNNNVAQAATHNPFQNQLPQRLQGTQSFNGSRPSCKVQQMDDDINVFNKFKHAPRKSSVKFIDNAPNTVTSHGSGCPVNDMDSQVDQYIRKSVLHGAVNQNDAYNNDFSNESILEYQNDFFGFNDKVNFGSNEGIDPVDKINEMMMDKGNEMFTSQNKRISDVYAELTEKKFNSESKPHYPAQNMSTYHGINFNNNDSDTTTQFDDESVNNGGKFYGNIEANNSDYDGNMLL